MMRLARMAVAPGEEILFSSSALPLIAAATPQSRSACRSLRGGDTARSLPLQLREAAHGFRVQLQFGPVSAPSRATSVHST